MTPLSPLYFSKFAAAFGLDESPGAITFLRSSQNAVYAVRRGDEPYILRISHRRHRTLPQVLAELGWIRYLTSHVIQACEPIPALDGNQAICQITDDGTEVIATCFRHAPGRAISADDLTPILYRNLGALVAQMHIQAKAVTKNGDALRFAARPQWHESRLLNQDVTSLHQHLSPAFLRSVADLIQQIQTLAISPLTYGLIHGDVSFGNCHLHEGDLHIFDFDNCEHGYFLQDLATVLYDSIYCKVLHRFADPGLQDRIAPLWVAFWQGYVEQGPLMQINPTHLKTFFLLREAIIYIHYHRTLDTTTISDSFKAGLEVMRTNVESQTHQVDFDALA